MRWGVVTFPGSLDDHDALYAIDHVLGSVAVPLWHKERDLHGVDCVVLPGGFSYGDYLRSGAMARFSPIMESVAGFARAGGLVLGTCNGFQILCEAGLLPGALTRNRGLSFVCAQVHVRVDNAATPFTRACQPGEILALPIKHGEGCFVADEDTLRALEDHGQVVLRYVDSAGRANDAANPNGSVHNIAGITNRERNVFGLMPHPEHAVEKLIGGDDGLKIFKSIAASIAAGRVETATSVAPGH
jgi:phosphoribosylformylglycinamidine synthase subunit PurQ / glutaminase